MGKKNIRKAQSEIMWQIRNNVRKGNFNRVSELIMEVLKREDSDATKNPLIKTIYKECIAPWVERTDSDEPIPKQYENMLLEYARYEQGQENTKRALEVLKAIKNSENSKTRKKVKRQINLLSLSEEIAKSDNINIDAIEKIAKDIEQDVDSRTYMELISSVFGREFPIEKLNLGELEKYISGNRREPSDTEVTPVKGSYSEELQVENRMRFFKEELDIEPTIRFCDKGIFAGSILLELKDTDSILVEKIINMYADGSYEPNNYGSSTYILPKDKMLDLIKLQTKEKVKAQLKDDEVKEIAPIQHRENWKKNIKEAIEQMRAESKTQTTVTPDQEPIEDIETTGQTTTQSRFTSKTKIKDNSIANREFLQDINTSLDGILTNEMIEQLVKRTSSYSFEGMYNNRLKQKIFDSLELLDMPAEQMDSEAKKIFLVMKMTREDMSKLKNKEGSKGGISKEDLAYLTEQYSCYYDDALDVLRKGIMQGLPYKQIADEMRNCILIQDNKKTHQPEKTSINVPHSTEIPSETTTIDTAESEQNETKPEETNSSHTEITTPGIQRIIEDIAKNNNGSPLIINIANKIQDLLTRIAELDVEQLQADENLQTSIKEEEEAKQQAKDRITAQKIAQEKLAQAIQEEQKASALAEQAIKDEQEASKKKQELEERQKKIAEEKAKIQKKLEDFMEL